MTNTTARKEVNGKYEIGKVDYNNSGRKNCLAVITWKLDEDNNFSMQAEIWNPLKTDIYRGGQCVDEIAKYFPHNNKVKRMKAIWERWHLNNMKAGCEHQRAYKYEEKRIDPKELPTSTANRDEREILACWVSQKEHKDGLLGKRCPQCQYRYGTAWLKEEIPQEVIDEILSWSN